MLVLGLHGGYEAYDEKNIWGFSSHDAAAVLLRDGEVVSAIEDERLSRIKHCNFFPGEALRFVLRDHGVKLSDVDLIAVNLQESSAEELVSDRPWLRLKPNARDAIDYFFGRHVGQQIQDKVRFCNHHIAHAWSAFALSGFESSLNLVIDGSGDHRSGLVLVQEGTRLKVLREFSLDQSLGNFYTQSICVLGFDRFDEYKAMGLAPYGDPEMYRALFEKGYQLLPNGDYALADPGEWMRLLRQAGLLGECVRGPGQAFTQLHKDFAAGLQQALERIVFHVLTHFRAETGQKNLCLSGGVAHNCTMNGNVLRSGLFERMFVQPAAHDAGGALGAALFAYHQAQDSGPPRRPLQHLYWGSHIGSDEEIEKALSRWSDLITYERMERPAEQTARLLADGKVIGWVQGRSEFGPRALGNRSILADPRPSENKSLINSMIKKREGFRPFAPSVLVERAAEFFEVPETQTDLSFMIFVLKVREKHRAHLGAITHVDGTARVQTVSPDTNPLYWSLIREFEKLTDVPILLNTSFNNNAEPIVDSVDDAVTCYLTTQLHYLVAGSFLVRRKGEVVESLQSRTLVPTLPPYRTLTKRYSASGEPICELGLQVAEELFSLRTERLSPAMFALLQLVDGKASLGELASRVGHGSDEAYTPLGEEALALWAKRAVTLTPSSR